jgi:hypothetical protein
MDQDSAKIAGSELHASAATSCVLVYKMRKPVHLPDHVVVNYANVRVRCGKSPCRCESGKRHGPYWYAFWNDPATKRKRSFYLGKKFEPPIGPPRSRVRSARRAPHRKSKKPIDEKPVGDVVRAPP